MEHERLKNIKNNLLAHIESQVCNLYDADAQELGEAIDMLKDLEEALYYCTVTDAMIGKSSGNYNLPQEEHRSYRQDYPRMYYNPGMEHKTTVPDQRDGRSHYSRRMYMQAKEMGHDKATQLKELEKYMVELTSDVVEMLEGSSPEEVQYLEKKVAALANRIGQMK